MAFKSGDLEGHGSTLILFCSRYSIVTRAVVDLVLSCLNNSLIRSISCMRWGWRISSLYLTVVKLPRTCTRFVLRSFDTSWHYLHRSYPLPEHRRKRNVHSGDYIHVFCHHISAAENETRRWNKFFPSFGMSCPLICCTNRFFHVCVTALIPLRNTVFWVWCHAVEAGCGLFVSWFLAIRVFRLQRLMRKRFDSVDERPGCIDIAQE